MRYLVNSHWHFDHTGGNQPLPEDVTIIATAARRDGIDRVAVRRSAGQNALRDQARAEEEGNLERQR